MTIGTLFLVPLVFAFALVAGVTAAYTTRRVTSLTAARILMGVPLALGILAEGWLALLLISNDNAATALYVQVPLVLLALAFAGTIRPAGGWVLVQAAISGLLLLLGFATIFTAGFLIFMLDAMIFFGMLYTAAAVAERPDHRNDAYWRYHFSRNA